MSERIDTDTLHVDHMHVVCPRAAGHAVLRNDRPYTDPGIDYQQMVVERNAPRWLRMLGQYGFLEEARATARS